jgi:hypothetical protein
MTARPEAEAATSERPTLEDYFALEARYDKLRAAVATVIEAELACGTEEREAAWKVLEAAVWELEAG